MGGKASKGNETLLLRALGASPTLKIMDFFLDNPLSDYAKNELVRDVGISRATFFKLWKEMERSGAVKPTRKIGRATLFRLDRDNDVVKQLISLDMVRSRRAMEDAVEQDRKAMTVRPQAR